MLHTAFKLFVALDSTSTDAAAGCEKLVLHTEVRQHLLMPKWRDKETPATATQAARGRAVGLRGHGTLSASSGRCESPPPPTPHIRRAYGVAWEERTPPRMVRCASGYARQ